MARRKSRMTDYSKIPENDIFKYSNYKYRSERTPTENSQTTENYRKNNEKT